MDDKAFYVIIYDVNKKEFKPYNIIPYLLECYKEVERKPTTYEEFKQFILKESRYQWWARCEYEIILSDWPTNTRSEKWDIHRQVEMNINFITELIIKVVNYG